MSHDGPPTVDLPLPVRSRSQAAADAAGRVVRAAQALRHARRKDGLPRATLLALEAELDAAVDAYEIVR